jgi:2'-5' RNA ligase
MKISPLVEGITEDNKKGSMVAIMIPRNISSELQNVFSDVSGEAVDSTDMHITLLLVHEPEKKKKIVQAIKRVVVPPFSVDIREFGLFPPNEHNNRKYVLHAKPHFGRELKNLHHQLKKSLEQHHVSANNGPFDFSPHITIKYCDEEPGLERKIIKSFLCNKLHYATDGKYYFRNL